MRNPNYRVRQVKMLKKNKGIQYLLNVGYEILGNPIYIHDIDYKLLCHTENIITDDPLWNELITAGRYGEKTIDLFKNEYFIDAVANMKTIGYLTSDKLKYSRILGKIFSKNNITVACAIVVACKKPFEDCEPQIFEALCRKLSIEISENESYQAYGEMHQEIVIRDLIEGSIKDKRLYTRRVAEIYEGLKNFLYVAVSDISKCGNVHTRAAYYKSILKRTFPAVKCALYGSYIVIIFSSDYMALDAKKDLKRFLKLAEENDISIGISQSFENLFELRKYYTEAINALSNGLENSGGLKVYLYNAIPERQTIAEKASIPMLSR